MFHKQRLYYASAGYKMFVGSMFSGVLEPDQGTD